MNEELTKHVRAFCNGENTEEAKQLVAESFGLAAAAYEYLETIIMYLQEKQPNGARKALKEAHKAVIELSL